MAAVNVQVTVLSRGDDPTRHKLEVDVPQVFSLTTTDSGYASDTPAFATTVWNYYNGLSDDEHEARWTVWLGGDATGGGSATNDGVFGAISGASDIQTELNKHIAYVVTGDVVAPGS